MYVNLICASSCANYIFLGASRKYVRSGGTVMWHGAPYSGSDLIKQAHLAFFKRINVDDRITHIVPCDLENDAAFVDAFKSGERPGWALSRKALETEYKIPNIIYMWEDRTADQIQSWRKRWYVFFSNGCS